MAKNILTHNLSEPLREVTSAKVNVNVADGNLMIDELADSQQVLASGALQYTERQGLPSESMDVVNGQAILTLKAKSSGRPWLHFPWDACNAATEWRIHLNPAVQSDIIAHSGGGNLKLDLAGMAVTRLSADTGGGNLEVVLPDHAANLSVVARSGAGNVTVELGDDTTGSNTINASSGAGNVVLHLPEGIAACIHATTGMGKVIMDSRFNKMDDKTYQSPDYNIASDRIEITAQSGAGNVSVNRK